MNSEYCLTNHLLVAMPYLNDQLFDKSVVYICEHTKEGALGFVINKPLELAFADILIHLGHLNKQTQGFALDRPILSGGPCAKDRGFVLHKTRGRWKNSFDISETLALTTSQDIITSLGKGEGPKDALILFGCSRWSAGQLERELTENSWLTVPATDAMIFETPFEDRWVASATAIGIDFERMSYAVGHA